MGYGGKTVNGLSSLGPKMGGKAHGGGVKIEKGMGKISQSQDDVLSGKETKMENDSMGSAKMISGSHSKGKFMSTPKYKSDAQRNMGPEKELVGNQNKLPQELKDKIEAAPGKYGMSQDHKMAYDRSEISRLKKDIHFDDLKKKAKK